MCDSKPKVPLSDLILAAICYLQEKNGVPACEIAGFIAKKRGCDADKILQSVKNILCKAVEEGILRKNNGLYRIKCEYDDLPKKDDEKVDLCEEESEDDDEDDDDEDEQNNQPIDPCKCLKLSRECLSEEDENRCGEKKCPKKRKCK
ncbi:hypothetical protein RUM43_004412 [Polyplax serrata]